MELLLLLLLMAPGLMAPTAEWPDVLDPSDSLIDLVYQTP